MSAKRKVVALVATSILSATCGASNRSLADFFEVVDLARIDCPMAFEAYGPLIETAHYADAQSRRYLSDADIAFVTDLRKCASQGEPCCERFLAAEIEAGGFGLTQDKNRAYQLYLTAAKAGDLDANYQVSRLARELGISLSPDDYSGVRLLASRNGPSRGLGQPLQKSAAADPMEGIREYCPSAYDAFRPVQELSNRSERRPNTEWLAAFSLAKSKLFSCGNRGEACCQNLVAEGIEDGNVFVQDKFLSLQLYLSAAAGGDLDAKESAERLSGELGVEPIQVSRAATSSTSKSLETAASQAPPISPDDRKAHDRIPNSSPVSAFIDLREFATTRSLEIAKEVLYGSEVDALQRARVCALDGDVYCTYLCGLLNEYGAPGIAISQATAISRYEQAALNGVEPAALAVSRLRGSSVTAVESSAPVLPRSDPEPSTARSPTADASNVTMPREVSSPNTAVVAAPIRDHHPTNGVIPRSNSIEPQSYSIRKIYRSGVEVLIVEGPVSIEMNPAGKDGKSYLYDFRVFNFTGRSLDVSPAMFVASQGGERVLVHSYAEMEKKLKSKHRWQKVGAALAVGLDAYSTGQRAGRGYASGSFSGRSYNHSQGSTRFSGTFQVTYDDPLARELAFQAQRQRTQNLVGSLNSKQGFELSELSDTYLRRQTVQPQEGYAGSISVARAADRSKRSQPVTIKFSLNGQSFQFDLPVPQ